MVTRLIPKIVDTYRDGYTGSKFRDDLVAGLIVGILAIPMSIAFAIASGARPESGLITAVVAGMIAALTTGSRYQITGPTGAFVVLIFSIIQDYGFSGLYLATFIAGIILLIMGFSKMGSVIKFIPYPVTIGFTSGIALLILFGQLPDILGLALPKEGGKLCLRCFEMIIKQFTSINLYYLATTLASLLIVIYWPKLKTVIPGPLMAIIVTSSAVYALGLPIETVGDRFGVLNFSVETFQLKLPEFHDLRMIMPAAIAIALLSAIESLLSAVVADGMTGRRHRSNMELISQGCANIGCALVSGLPATGAIARTATNIKAGAISPVACWMQALVIFILTYFFQSWIRVIPMPTLAGILIFVAYNMSEWRHFIRLLWSPVGDIAVLLTTFFLTIFVDLVTGIEVGIIFAAFIFMNRMAESTRFDDLKLIDTEESDEEFYHLKKLGIPKDIEIFDLQGTLFFAAAEKFKTALSRINDQPKVLILRMRKLITIDSTGIRALKDIIDQSKKKGTVVILSGVSHKSELYKQLKLGGIIDSIGKEYIKPNIELALDLAKNM